MIDKICFNEINFPCSVQWGALGIQIGLAIGGIIMLILILYLFFIDFPKRIIKKK